ncbi:hypothetical protein Tco_0869097 [Tanacetum coccineum]
MEALSRLSSRKSKTNRSFSPLSSSLKMLVRFCFSTFSEVIDGHHLKFAFTMCLQQRAKEVDASLTKRPCRGYVDIELLVKMGGIVNVHLMGRHYRSCTIALYKRLASLAKMRSLAEQAYLAIAREDWDGMTKKIKMVNERVSAE